VPVLPAQGEHAQWPGDGFEALLRWLHPPKGRCPGDFLPLVEQTDLIVELGEWVIDQALGQFSSGA
jgi:EAL domain-containing protein (putative c-di-GMP-specific phosphodiesterase class I)